jgi:hypothetical protein
MLRNHCALYSGISVRNTPESVCDMTGIRKRLALATRDAHSLYKDYGGFEVLRNPERWLERRKDSTL